MDKSPYGEFVEREKREMVPVLDKNKVPLMPCTEKRARQMMDRKQAIPYWQKGIFCIKLTKEPSDRKYQLVALGIDPGSKREGYTVMTEKSVVLNITTNTPHWVKEHVEIRRGLRHERRRRKTPYRRCRPNRASLRKKGRLPPSTKARWDAKLNMMKSLMRILPITVVNIEDICAVTKKGARKWNVMFSPLENGKHYFYNEIDRLGVKLVLTKGYETKARRDERDFTKSKKKLDFKWEAHNVDSHVLCELALGKDVRSFKGLYRIDYLQYWRRKLHVIQPIKGGKRKRDGGTVSLGLSRGSTVRYRDKLYYLGGTSNGRLSIHDIVTTKRISQVVKINDIKVLTFGKKRVQFLSTPKKKVTN